jgi:hypothetical protein
MILQTDEMTSLLHNLVREMLSKTVFTETCGGGAITTTEALIGAVGGGERPELASIAVMTAQLLPHTSVQIILDGELDGHKGLWMGLGFSVADDGCGDMVSEVDKATKDAARLIAEELCSGDGN